MRPAPSLRLASAGEGPCEVPHVLEGAVFTGVALRLARLVERGFLDEAGWDPRVRVLYLPAEHQLLGRQVCRAPGCTRSVFAGLPGVCHRCFTRLSGLGLSATEVAAAPQLPPPPSPAERCAVAGCQCQPTVRGAVLCQPHAKQFRAVRRPVGLEEFLADGRTRPMPQHRACLVAACTRPADGAGGYCNTHYQRWRVASRGNPGLDRRSFQARESGAAEPGQVNLRALPPLVVVEVLFGAQERTRAGGKLSDGDLRPLCDLARREQASSLEELEAGRVPANTTRKLLRAFARDIRRALADPGSEQAKDTWDLAVFGHPGRLSFSRITQPWLRQAAKAWAADDLPRHRGKGAAKVVEKVHALAELSASLRCRRDQGDLPASLGRPDIENFLNRLAYLESTGKMSRYHRNVVCRGTRLVLAGIRALGLTRAGEAAAGLPDVFMIVPGDVPGDPERAEPGRDLPPEVMAVLCANLDSLEPAEVRVAVEVAIDTGRRPEEILSLPLECLAVDKDGGAVLVYDNKKANRLGRRLPVSEATAAVISAQQERVRARFPSTPPGELKLLPAPRRNPDGRTAMTVDMLEGRHRAWVASLGLLVSRDGAELGPDRAVPYAYRHSYAQRHADAGVPLDLLADLLDQRNLNITRRYYRIGEGRRRAAVERVAALSFDRLGKRVWAEAEALLESEHARYAIGEVAVPYGVCTEPSNVKAGGNACPFRFRCVGCGHFRTDVSYLPDLEAYLDDLLRNRERVLAAHGLDNWARAEAVPSEDEVTCVRRLIAQVRAGLDDLSPEDRAQVDDAVATVRRHRSATLTMARVRLPLPGLRPERPE